MSSGPADPDRKPLAGDATRTLAEQMLDRYGIGYVCAHPEILFRDGCRLPPLSEQYAHVQGIARPAYGAPKTAAVAHQPPGPGDLVNRLDEAYEILREVYAPHRPTAVYHHAPSATGISPARIMPYRSTGQRGRGCF